MSSDKTGLGDRMKGQYEVRAQTLLPRRTYTIIRLDGKSFHTYTRGCEKPHDRELSVDMQVAAGQLCKQAQGARFAYVQSDEISVLLTDFATDHTDAWFDGNVQKIVSVSASIVTAWFNSLRRTENGLAYFDARVFTIPDPTEVKNYFVWRQRDCVRNSIMSLAQAHFSHKQLHGKNTDELQEMLWSEKRINWADENSVFKNGALVTRTTHTRNGATRSQWDGMWSPMFSQNMDVLDGLVPEYD